ncbi:MAG: addiction module antitoxin [Synergistaceae bacterium]|nr:addiction module antitoxin [Synergistaceae bacterium]
MRRKMTITLDEAVYEEMYRMMGRRDMSRFIENLVRVHVMDLMDTSLDEGYLAMAEDEEREIEAMEWCNAFAGEMDSETR